MGKNVLKTIATGDMFITRRIAKDGYEGFEEVRDCIMEHDVKFSNLEMTFHDQEGYPAAESGGTWAMMALWTISRDSASTSTTRPTTIPVITARRASWPPSAI